MTTVISAVPPPGVTIKAAARVWGCSTRTVQRMIQREQIEVIRIGSGRGRILIPFGELHRVLQRPLGPTPAAELVDDWRMMTGLSDPEELLVHIAVGVLMLREVEPDLGPWAEGVVMFQRRLASVPDRAASSSASGDDRLPAQDVSATA